MRDICSNSVPVGNDNSTNVIECSLQESWVMGATLGMRTSHENWKKLTLSKQSQPKLVGNLPTTIPNHLSSLRGALMYVSLIIYDVL